MGGVRVGIVLPLERHAGRLSSADRLAAGECWDGVVEIVVHAFAGLARAHVPRGTSTAAILRDLCELPPALRAGGGGGGEDCLSQRVPRVQRCEVVGVKRHHRHLHPRRVAHVQTCDHQGQIHAFKSLYLDIFSVQTLIFLLKSAVQLMIVTCSANMASTMLLVWYKKDLYFHKVTERYTPILS